MKNKAAILVLLTAALAGAEFNYEKAKRLDDFLTRIAQLKSRPLLLRQMTFSEHEFNSYLNLVYVKRYAPEVKYIELELREKNRVRGRLKLKLDARQYSRVPAFLRDVEVRFAGRVECESQRMRYWFDELAVNGASFSPQVLDEVYGLAQFNSAVKNSIYDWFSLLPGLKKFSTGDKSITLFY